MKRIAIVTSTRADWGLLSPIARKLAENDNIELHIIATNMHLDRGLGYTLSEIIDEGYEPICVEMPMTSDSPVDVAIAAGKCLEGMAKAFDSVKPDLLLILGDRFEMLAVATAATIMGIPIAHIAGGEITLGAIDDNIRHAISKLPSLHFATTETHRRRLIAMGEHPALVLNTGAIGVSNIRNIPLMSREKLSESLGFQLKPETLLVTYHVVTNDPTEPTKYFAQLLDALDNFPDYDILLTYPNNDPRGGELIRMIEEYGSRWPGRVHIVPSLGRVRYLSALRCVAAVVGNSSSGIVEAPSAGIPTVNVGYRQHGRTAGPSVIHCDDDTHAIIDAIEWALTPEQRAKAATSPNPYEKHDTLEIITRTLISIDPKRLLPKVFYNNNL